MKKKLCSLLIAICLFAFVLLSFAACASSDLKYEAMYGDDSYWWSVSGSYGDSTVKIPKKHNGVAVRTISSWAFSGDENLKKVTIPNTIDSIGEFAFDNCKSLKKVNLPRALKLFILKKSNFAEFFIKNRRLCFSGLLCFGNGLFQGYVTRI